MMGSARIGLDVLKRFSFNSLHAGGAAPQSLRKAWRCPPTSSATITNGDTTSALMWGSIHKHRARQRRGLFQSFGKNRRDAV